MDVQDYASGMISIGGCPRLWGCQKITGRP
jgi:hypothetical protein